MELSLTGSLPESWEKLTLSFSTRPRWIDSPGPEQTRHAHVFCVLIRPPAVPSIHRLLLGGRAASEAPSDLVLRFLDHGEIQMFEYFDII